VTIKTQAEFEGRRMPLQFSGDGGEYFRIWIVNLLLTILTLGLYSPWAKVRRLQYFHRHTRLGDASFDFHGRPMAILLGRIVALLVLAAYKYSVSIRSPLTLAMLAVIALLLPWLLRNSFRFRLYNTSWRGLRFSFRGSLKGAYHVFLLRGLMTLGTLYLLAPGMHQKLKAYQHGNTWLGTTPFSFHATVNQFYLRYLVWLAAPLLMALFAVLIAIANHAGWFGHWLQLQPHAGKARMQSVVVFLAIGYSLLLLLVLIIGPLFQALIANLVWNNTRLGEHRLACNQSPLRLLWIQISNFVLILLTLGFFTPWAMVRSARYRIESLSLLPAGDLQEFTTGQTEVVGAIGEETAAVFDFDISL
jgi:uncharacterized membrane protein YjgN (DUF898 family)